MLNSTGTIDIPEHWARLKEDIDRALSACCELPQTCPAPLQDAIRYSLLGPGKRLRPLLTLFAADACGGQMDRAMPAACAVEMIHAYSLIHDDLPCMDDDDLRRGRPTCHVKFGESTAVLAGDALIARAFELVATQLRPAEVAAACCQELAHAAGPCNLVGGQYDDLNLNEQQRSLEKVAAIHQRKTGAMFLAPLRIGAIIGTGGPPPREIDRYGTSLGLAFQIVDDLLDSEGAQETVGKKTGKDQARGKSTFPGLLGVEESRERAAELIATACEAAEVFGDRKENLVTLARFVLYRDR